MQAVLELDMQPEELTGYRDNTQAMVEWNLTLSTLLLLLMLTIVSLSRKGGRWMGDHAGLTDAAALHISLAAVFIGIALLYALMHRSIRIMPGSLPITVRSSARARQTGA
jgi:hypothetical protein